ncbi:MAG: hypothetical protein QM765_41925 [Myxococcales bacterium]
MASSYLGQAPPDTAIPWRSPTFTVVRSMGQCVPQPLSWQVNSARLTICAFSARSSSRREAASSDCAPLASTAHRPMPQAPMAPGLGGTTMSRPVTAARVHASDGFVAGLPWKKMVGAKVRWPITRCR